VKPESIETSLLLGGGTAMIMGGLVGLFSFFNMLGDETDWPIFFATVPLAGGLLYAGRRIHEGSRLAAVLALAYFALSFATTPSLLGLVFIFGGVRGVQGTLANYKLAE